MMFQAFRQMGKG